MSVRLAKVYSISTTESGNLETLLESFSSDTDQNSSCEKAPSDKLSAKTNRLIACT
jgi:hypothetical protein